MAYLSNGKLELVAFLPDAKNGYYRGTRFDWGGLVACASFDGHRYFGEWTDGYDPLRSDAVVGPAEEFRAPDGKEPGYAEAAPGEAFVKPGVGVLRKLRAEPYRFGEAYPLLDGGTWTATVKNRSIIFTQILKTPLGYAYRYTKTLEIDRRHPILRLKHTLTNLGSKTISTDVYAHDFFVLDGRPVGPGQSVTLGFAPQFPKPLGTAASVQKRVISFIATPSRNDTAQGYVEGYTGAAGEYRILVEDRNSGARVEQSSASPLSKFYFWSTSRTICPEAYTGINVAPGKSQQWTISYAFGPERSR